MKGAGKGAGKGGMNLGQLAVDDYGNPFILVEEQDAKSRLKGLDAHRANILAAKAVAETIRTSLGPKGMDKMIVGPDGDVTVTNDGATILAKMEVEHQVARLLCELSNSQDNEIGDGTTGVVVMAGALLDGALRLLEKGIHPLRVAYGYERACEVAVKKVQEISTTVDVEADDHEALKRAARTALGSKIVSSCQDQLAQLCVDAVLAVTDKLEGRHNDVNFDLIKLETKVGGQLSDSALIKGIVLDKDFSHPQMPKQVTNAKIAVLTCPFEPPKPKTKHKLDIKTAEDYHKLYATEQKYFTDMLDRLQAAGCTLAVCQWGFDDEANHLLYQRKLPAIRWVGGVELELLAIATNARIVPRFEELTADKLGFAETVKERSFGTMGDSVLVIEGCANSRTVTVLIRGSSKTVVDEAQRSIHDANCCVRNLLRDPWIVPGGGASELAASRAVMEAADANASTDQYAMRVFAEALEAIPIALAENSGLPAMSEVAKVKAAQISEKNDWLGIDCMRKGMSDMRKQYVHESKASKVNQLRLATQVVKMILKIDDVIAQNEDLTAGA